MLFGGWRGGFLGWLNLAWVELTVNTRHSHYQYCILVNSQLYAPSKLHHGKETLLFSGGVFAVLVLNMADPLSTDRTVVIQCIAIYCNKLQQLICCHVHISINIVMFQLYCVCVHVQVRICSVLCSERKQRRSVLLQPIANILHVLQTVNTHQCQ